ncbi:MAG: hypothetical protein Q7R60_01630 [bacterium]|nr:hypothetical protein [bacterium]
MKQNKNSRTKIFKFHNLIADYSTKNLERDKQGGFIPMLIMFLIILAAVIWLVFSRVSTPH